MDKEEKARLADYCMEQADFEAKTHEEAIKWLLGSIAHSLASIADSLHSLEVDSNEYLTWKFNKEL